MIIKTFTAAIIALAASVATAQPVTTDIRVSYADLNLGSDAGQAVLAKRIETAANSACGANANQRDLSMKRNSSSCSAAAVSKANLAIASAKAPVFASR